jgi:DNA-binding NtrC family response regulator
MGDGRGDDDPMDDANLSKVTDMAPGHRPLLPRRVRMVVLSGPDQGKELALARGAFVVGKGTGSSFVLSDSQVSRKHLEVSLTEQGIVVRDLGSKNGSFYGGVRFSEITVGAGAVVKLGGTELKFVSPDTPASLPPSSATRFGRMIGGSLRMREIYAVLERVALSDVPILIGGETGTGKELCAEAIHQASRVAGGPFVICDLAGLPRSLMESELFGHVRGAFTGADRDREGAFVRANRGTIFLDEIGELELDMQPRLLRALEQRQVKPVGASSYRPVDIRVVAATNRNLPEECRAGRFREDLLHRLSVITVTLPPLRERKEDIPMLINAWLEPRGVALPDETMAILMEHDWPGNIRELRNIIDRGLSLLGGAKVLEPAFLGLSTAPMPHPPSGAPPTIEGNYKRAKEVLIATWERSFVINLLKRSGGNVSRAAREGGIDRAYLHRLMRKYDISDKDG